MLKKIFTFFKPGKSLNFITKSIIILITVCGIFLFVGQTKFNKNSYVKYFYRIVANFINSSTETINSWFIVDSSNIKINNKEKHSKYKLRLVAKSLDNYFQNLMLNSEKTVSSYQIEALLSGKSYNVNQKDIQKRLKHHLYKNKDILEISIYNIKGDKLSSMRYRNIPAYKLNQSIIPKLKKKDNLLVKDSTTGNMIIVSAIKRRNALTGFITQTLNPVFFTKILDFLDIKENLFYIKNYRDELVLDNYNAYQYINNKKHSVPFMLYNKLTSSSSKNIKLNIDNVNYALGMIIEDNNMAGNLLAVFFIFIIVYMAILLINIGWKNIAQLIFLKKNHKEYGQQPDNKPEEKKGNISNTMIDEIDKEITKLQKEGFKNEEDEIYADTFIK
ncbi:MAG TPA: hypothetical protein VKS21_06340 [Spirochaetota bacterium]|nr:hypothetical protein [Spirochaetota bacterium]